MSDEYFKLPRIYSEDKLVIQANISLPVDQVHYLRNVLRRQNGDKVRLFDGENGEFLATLNFQGKKKVNCLIEQKLKEQPTAGGRAILLFSPLAKVRMDMLVEKAVELGVTDLMPVITHRTENRKINYARIGAQIIEATEQCERMVLPILHDITSLSSLLIKWPGDMPAIQWCCERDYTQRQMIGFCKDEDQAFLIGPAGGFDDEECNQLSGHSLVIPVSLGEGILRAETASILCLSSYKLVKTVTCE